jgi:hypothetical protein
MFIGCKGAASLVAVAAMATLQGCGTTMLSSRGTNPVIQDFAYRWLSDDSALSTTASRRLALMSYRRATQDGRPILVTCAEPPPDVGETFAKALAAQIEVSAPQAAGNAKVGVGFGEQVATAIAPLMVRTQGLQILRDSAFTLCVDYMNGWIKDSDTYMQIKQDRFDKAIALIAQELPHLPGRTKVPVETLAAPTLPPPAVAPLPGAAASGANQ